MYIYICVCKMYVYAQILQYIFTINVKLENQVFPVIWLYKLTRINFFFFFAFVINVIKKTFVK